MPSPLVLLAAALLAAVLFWSGYRQGRHAADADAALSRSQAAHLQERLNAAVAERRTTADTTQTALVHRATTHRLKGQAHAIANPAPVPCHWADQLRDDLADSVNGANAAAAEPMPPTLPAAAAPALD